MWKDRPVVNFCGSSIHFAPSPAWGSLRSNFSVWLSYPPIEMTPPRGSSTSFKPKVSKGNSGPNLQEPEKWSKIYFEIYQQSCFGSNLSFDY